MAAMAPDNGVEEVRPGVGANEDAFYSDLYDGKAEYVARRAGESLEARLIQVEVEHFKVPNLVAVLPQGFKYSCVVEVGCATGELLAAFPAPADCRRVGFDISQENVKCARERHPGADFRFGDFRNFEGRADIVILSDVLEHVPDDQAMLEHAGRLGRLVLINLPLEDNWLNAARNYGPSDVSGHLRRYSLDQGFSLIRAAGLTLLDWRRLWVHETECDLRRRRLRKEILGSEFSGGPLASGARRLVWSGARTIRPLGRRLFASNLFASATRRLP